MYQSAAIQSSLESLDDTRTYECLAAGNGRAMQERCNRDRGGRLKVFLYSHDTFGLGHLRRNLAIATCLLRRPEKFSVHLITGSPVIAQWRLPYGLHVQPLPPVVKTGVESYSAREAGRTFGLVKGYREALILKLLLRHQPDIFLVDHAPAGMNGELLSTLALIGREFPWIRTMHNASGATLESMRDQLDTLAWLFKQTSDILIPLSKEGVLLQQYRHNLSNWRDAIKRQYQDALAVLGVRVGILVGLLVIVFAGGELWRRVALHYARDPHRRYQLLLLQRLTVWTVAIVIIGLSVISQLSSFATFAGLLTAGAAVAMQSVLVSIVGYFFLIGKYGIRVGDRVQIGNVTGEVIDLGLVRMHLMELTSQGPLGPTGRIVDFANSIVFQGSGGLFKQIPGVNFAWHETTLSLPAGADYAAVQDKLLAAVSGVVQEYQEEIVRQTKTIEKTTSSSSVSASVPQVQLRLLGAGVEAVVRYPVPFQRAAEIDERVSKELLRVISSRATGGIS
jgi:small-conductance mechanosensitive channel